MVEYSEARSSGATDPRGLAPRRFAAPPAGSKDTSAELVIVVKSDERQAAPPRPRRPIGMGDWVWTINPDERPGQPAGEVIAIDDFPPGRSISVQPPGGVFWVRWDHEVEHVPRG